MAYSVEPKYEIEGAIAEASKVPGKDRRVIRVVTDPVRIIYRDLARRTWDSQEEYRLKRLEERMEELEKFFWRHVHTLDDLAHRA